MEIVSENLRIARDMLKGVTGKEEMLSIICLATHKPAERFTYFNYPMGAHSYRGYIYNPMVVSEQGALYGTIFALWDNTVQFIVRGYPKIIYAQVPVAGVVGRYCYAEEKVDGTNLTFFNLPNGKLMGKTRAVPRYDLGGYQGRQWNELAAMTGRLEGIRKITKEDYNPVVELHGMYNQCDFIDYPDITIEIKGLDIVDNRTYSFLPYKKKIQLFEDADIPIAELFWEGVLDENNLTYLENEAEKRMGTFEGFMAKYWSELYQDQFFGKIKCHAMRELARLRSGGALSKEAIGASIRKGLDNLPMIDSLSELHSIVIEDLYSEHPQHYVDASLIRIERLIAKAFPLNTFNVWSYLSQLEDSMVITIDNKAEVMGMLSKQFWTDYPKSKIRINPSRQYKAFILYLRRKGRGQV